MFAFSRARVVQFFSLLLLINIVTWFFYYNAYFEAEDVLQADTDKHHFQVKKKLPLESKPLLYDFAVGGEKIQVLDPFDGKAKRVLNRAVMGYLPRDKLYLFLPHLRWLLRSWQEMQKNESEYIRTDVVVVVDAVYDEIQDLDCSERIRTEDDHSPGRCILVSNYTRVSEYDKDLKKYDFAESIASVVFASEKGAAQAYDLILRTDLDVFLTPAFSNWTPTKLVVGKGLYCFSTEQTCSRLKRIANDMQLAPADGNAIVENVGSTWYGKADVVVRCAALSLKVMRYLSANEFEKEAKERYFHGNVSDWPAWHFGVLTMYGGQIAINHCAQESGGFEKREDLLDFSSHFAENIEKVPHIHTWHTRSNFSKGLFFEHAYDKVDLDTLNLTIVNDYAMYMALDANGLGVRGTTKEEESTTMLESNNKTLNRAVVGYLPRKNLAVYLANLKWLLRSWREMQASESSHIRTDIVIVVDQVYKEIKEMNCTSVTRTKVDTSPGRCIWVPGYTSVSSYDTLLKGYEYAESIDTIGFADDVGALKAYDLILRTDLDVFLTPAFANWIPSRLVVGKGLYCFDGQVTCSKLKRIAKDMGIAPANDKDIVENVGSTWYGDARVVIRCAALSMKAMRYMSGKEFEPEMKERFFKGNVSDWPGWHFGVLTMYGGQIAINHCAKDDGGFEKRADLLDFAAHSSESIDKVPHIHAWHTDENFSKIHFFNHKYDKVDLNSLDLSIVKDYATYMALDGNGLGVRGSSSSQPKTR